MLTLKEYYIARLSQVLPTTPSSEFETWFETMMTSSSLAEVQAKNGWIEGHQHWINAGCPDFTMKKVVAKPPRRILNADV